MKTRLLFFLTALAVSFASCSKIEVDARNKFTGRYEVEEYSYVTHSPSYYDSRIRKLDNSEDEVTISNFYNADIEVVAKVVGSRIYIPVQTVGYFEVEGQGTLSNNKINLAYTVIAEIGGSVFEDELVSTMFKKF